MSEVEGQWTFSNLDVEWVHDSYSTKEEAVEVAKDVYIDEEGFLVGQLEHNQGVNYNVVNQEKIMFD